MKTDFRGLILQAQGAQNLGERTITTAAEAVILPNDFTLAVNLDTPGPLTIPLPAVADLPSEPGSVRLRIRDAAGNAATHNITISATGTTINGAATYVISTNGGNLDFEWTGSVGSGWVSYTQPPGTGIVTAISVTAPIVDTGTPANPNIGISPATTLAPGSLAAADKAKLDALPSALSLPVSVANGGTGSATGSAASLNNIPAGQLTGDVARARITTALAAGGDPVSGTVLTAATRVETPTIGTAAGAQHALPSGTAALVASDDARLNPTPSVAGKIPYDNGSGYSAATNGTSSQLLHGGAAPSFGAVALGSEVSGTLPIANGGTNSGTALNNNRAMVSSGGAVVESNSGSDTQVLTGTDPPSFQSLTASMMPAIDVQSFVGAGGTWTKPAGARIVEVICIGGGGSGGSGSRYGSGTACSGGAGGGGGSRAREFFAASQLGATETVTGGAAATGASAITMNDTDGDPGNPGQTFSFGNWVRANGGDPGDGGNTATSTGGPGATGQFSGGTGASGPAGSVPTSAGGSQSAGAGGGGGGGITGGNAARDGGTGGFIWSSPRSTASGGSAGGGGNPGTAPGGYLPGLGGGGGASSTGASGGTGGAGGNYGGGGGGGGASRNGFSSGAGGAGGAGACFVISY